MLGCSHRHPIMAGYAVDTSRGNRHPWKPDKARLTTGKRTVRVADQATGPGPVMPGPGTATYLLVLFRVMSRARAMLSHRQVRRCLDGLTGVALLGFSARLTTACV